MNRKTNKQGDYGLGINRKASLTFFFFRALFCFARFFLAVPSTFLYSSRSRGRSAGLRTALNALRVRGETDRAGPGDEGQEKAVI